MVYSLLIFGFSVLSHNFGTPRVLNPAAANYYDFLLGGYQIDRGAANADIFMSMVPQSDEWAFTSE